MWLTCEETGAEFTEVISSQLQCDVICARCSVTDVVLLLLLLFVFFTFAYLNNYKCLCLVVLFTIKYVFCIYDFEQIK